MRSGLRRFVAMTLSLVGLAVVTGRGADPAFSEIQLQLADLMIAEERFGDAIEAFTRAKAGATPEQLFRARSGTVRSMLRLARFGEAHEEANLLKAEGATDPAALAVYGDALWAIGLFDEAEQVFRDALAIDAETPRGHHGLAKSFATLNQMDAALDAAQTALKLSPRDGEFHHSVGVIYERMRRFAEAAIAFGNYMNLLPKKGRSDRAVWSRAEIRFLRSFGRRVPIAFDPEGAEQLHTVPFKLVRDKIIVPARVNGRRSIDFVVDTGAEQMVLSKEGARRSNVEPIVYTLSAGVGEVGLRGLLIGRMDSLQIGNLRIENVPCLIKDPPLSGIPRREAESFSPLALGLSMTIDYERRLLTLGRQIPETPADVALPMRLHRLATVRGTVNSRHPASFVVDTGGEVISISQETAGSLETKPMVRRLPLKVYGSSGWDPDAFLLPGVDLMFKTIEFPNYPVVVLNLRAPSALLGFRVGGIIGYNFLSRYRVAIDLQNSVIRLNEIDQRS